MRRAQVDDVLKWIFIIIIGVFILSFFINLVFRTSESTSKEIDMTLRDNFGNYLDSVIIRNNLENTFGPSKSTYSFELYRDEIDFGSSRLDVSDYIIFGDVEFETNYFAARSLPFTSPFHMTNTISLYDLNKKYIILHSLDSVTLSKLNNSLSTNNFQPYFYELTSNLDNSLSAAKASILSNEKIFSDDDLVFWIFYNPSDFDTFKSRIVSFIDSLGRRYDNSNVKLIRGLKYSNSPIETLNKGSLFATANVTFMGSSVFVGANAGSSSLSTTSIKLYDESAFFGSLVSGNLKSYLDQTSKLFSISDRFLSLQLNRTVMLKDIDQYIFCAAPYAKIQNTITNSRALIGSINSGVLGDYDLIQVQALFNIFNYMGINISEANYALRGGAIVSCPDIK